MSITRRILCAVDFSDGARHALAVATRIAQERGATLELVHAWQVPYPVIAGELAIPQAIIDELQADAQRGLDAMVRDAVALGAPRATGTLVAGTAWEQICDVATRDRAVELIVVGTQGRTGLPRVLLGSVAAQIVRHAPCPVLAVRRGVEVHPFRRVLVAVDFSPAARAACELAIAALAPGGTLTLVHVVDLPVKIHGELHPIEMFGAIDRRAVEVLETWRAQLTPKLPTGATIAIEVRIGYAGAQLLAAAEHDHSDLVVAGSHGRTGITRLLLGSVAEKLVRESPCPVLVAHARQ